FSLLFRRSLDAFGFGGAGGGQRIALGFAGGLHCVGAVFAFLGSGVFCGRLVIVVGFLHCRTVIVIAFLESFGARRHFLCGFCLGHRRLRSEARRRGQAERQSQR